MIRLAIIGLGRMGRAVEQLANERGFEVVARIGKEGAMTRETTMNADVAVEFTSPLSAPGNIRAAIEAGCPIVVGTTGWYDERPAIEQLALDRGAALLIAPNFSPGVAAFTQSVQQAARALRSAPGFDAHIIETHHTAKKDAPSGTAAQLAAVTASDWGRRIPVTSVRTGSVPGTHEVLFDAPFEQIRITHVARDRRLFADGALTAARWIIGKRGVFTIGDVFSV
jgi:4-hydroxy-tetrahydrodipicolinate reductase